MTKKELSQLYFLNREIEYKKIKVEQLESLAQKCTQIMSGMPVDTTVYDKISTQVAEIVDMKQLIELKKLECIYEHRRCVRYIETITSSEIRMILTLRYINGLKWAQVAAHISVYATADSVRKIHDRYMRENE